MPRPRASKPTNIPRTAGRYAVRKAPRSFTLPSAMVSAVVVEKVSANANSGANTPTTPAPTSAIFDLMIIYFTDLDARASKAVGRLLRPA